MLPEWLNLAQRVQLVDMQERQQLEMIAAVRPQKVVVASDDGVWLRISLEKACKQLIPTGDLSHEVGVRGFLHESDIGSAVKGMLLGYAEEEYLFGGQVRSYFAHHPVLDSRPQTQTRSARACNPFPFW